MPRFRRYRVFLIFAVITIGALYHFTNVRNWENTTASGVDSLKKHVLKETPTTSDPMPAAVNETPKDGFLQSPTATPPELTPAAVPIATSAAQDQASTTSSASLTGPSTILVSGHGIQKGLKNGDEMLLSGPPVQLLPSSEAEAFEEKFEAKGQGRHEVQLEVEADTRIHWKRLPEHFPIPLESLIALPTGKPKAMPNIQFDFKDESSNSKIDRERQLLAVKQVFQKSWAGYKEHAWLKDELSPISGKSRNPFCGWAATLVDSLDTLWIMGLKEEFDEAARAVDSIDFTTTNRNDIPLFETVIRYLGGLIAAYDLSEGKYTNLLNKAIELAEILMGAFDTPNRMPMTFYYWKPTFAANAHRAGTRVVLAELGSLSVEFTRLAQITKQAKYYDAIARITNEFEIWQYNTKLPGMWPITVDASGCKKPEMRTTPLEQAVLSGGKVPMFEHSTTGETSNTGNEGVPSGQPPQIPDPVSSAGQALTPPSQGLAKSKIQNWAGPPDMGEAVRTPTEKVTTLDDVAPAKAQLGKRQLLDEMISADMDTVTGADAPKPSPFKQADCEAQGLAAPPKMAAEEFSLGGRSDSTYEYLPKQYMLLGGLEDQYRTMYEQSIEAIKAHLLYRPMVQGDRNILFSGSVRVSGNLADGVSVRLTTEAPHLTCFAGGMFAVGAKIFGHEADMDIAAKLTDGCVWAYESTTTGIMPEDSVVVGCQDNEDCAWNETRWHEALDPYREGRERNRLAQEERNRQDQEQAILDRAGKAELAQSGAETEQSVVLPVQPSELPKPAELIAPPIDSLSKRQIGHVSNKVPGGPPIKEAEDFARTPTNQVPQQEIKKSADFDKKTETVEGYVKAVSEAAEAAAKQNTPGSKPIPVTPPPPTPILSHDEYVKERIEKERLPPGFIKIKSKKYILRPEAIESVFIMYRATGDDYWRDKGWGMFTAIQNYTRADYGNSAIHDVTDPNPFGLDEMESFWLAETLKYFYLLFSDPSVVSLDDYVLNTEAHPFKRPR